MDFVVIISVVTVLSVGLCVLSWVLFDYDHDLLALTSAFFGVVGIVVCGILLIAYAWASSSAPAKAKVLNEAYGTNYTAEDLIWADGIITEVIQGKRSRIDLTGIK